MASQIKYWNFCKSLKFSLDNPISAGSVVLENKLLDQISVIFGISRQIYLFHFFSEFVESFFTVFSQSATPISLLYFLVWFAIPQPPRNQTKKFVFGWQKKMKTRLQVERQNCRGRKHRLARSARKCL